MEGKHYRFKMKASNRVDDIQCTYKVYVSHIRYMFQKTFLIVLKTAEEPNNVKLQKAWNWAEISPRTLLHIIKDSFVGIQIYLLQWELSAHLKSEGKWELKVTRCSSQHPHAVQPSFLLKVTKKYVWLRKF